MPLRQIKSRTSLQTGFLLLRIFFRQYTNINYLLRWLLISLLVGGCAGTAAALFLYSLDWVTAARESNRWLITLLPLGGLAIGLLYHYKGRDVAAGNNLLIDTIHRPGQLIPFKMAPFVYLGTLLTHLLGGSAGREGTALQLSAAIADQFSKRLRLQAADRSVLIIAAVAAGFGAVFGTPLAGAVFGLEFFHTGKIRYHALFPALFSSLIADLVTRAWQVHHTVYHIGTIPPLSARLLLYSMIAGIVFGLVAALFSKLMHRITGWFHSRIAYAPLRPFAGGIIITCCVWVLGTTDYIGLGIPLIEASFLHSLPWYAFALKLGLTVITLASGFKGGEVTPLFFIGATLGNALSCILPMPYGLLAGMGFVAVFAGAANTPLACTLMAVELFGADCGPYAAIACVLAYLSSGPTGIYPKQVIAEAKHSSRSYDRDKLPDAIR